MNENEVRLMIDVSRLRKEYENLFNIEFKNMLYPSIWNKLNYSIRKEFLMKAIQNKKTIVELEEFRNYEISIDENGVRKTL